MSKKYATWRKSSRSSGGTSNCVEVALSTEGTVGVRDSKDRSGPVLEFPNSAWNLFITGIRYDRTV